MASREWTSGALKVTYPDSYSVGTAATSTATPRGGGRLRRSTTAGPTAPAQETVTAALLDAFADQDLQLVAPVELVPARPAPGKRAPSRAATVSVDLAVAPEESAVILLEQDGFYSWQLPTLNGAPTVRPRRGRAPVRRQVHFELDVRSSESATTRPGPSRTVRGPLGDFVVGRARAYVLKFVAGLVPGPLMGFLERHVTPGLVVMQGKDVGKWSRVSTLEAVKLPQDRPARILLFVHGTFSSTVGSYGALTSTDHGRAFLDAAGTAYDAIIGFDHPTLSKDPLENATDLLARLEKNALKAPATIDVVCYSRGGLVARSLVEHLLPSSPWHATVRRMVFVGATNAGTRLAEPANWNTFVDLYTNLAAASARAIGLLTGSAPAAEILGGVVKSVGAFVKYLVGATVTDRRVPGLAAMEPDGKFVRMLNDVQPGQPGAGTPWYAVSSDFEPKLFASGAGAPELPRRLLNALTDGLVDQLMGVQNDLVVDTTSMAAIDLESGGGFVKEMLDFGTNGVVYHLNYFVQPQVTTALAAWLEVRGPAEPAVPIGSVVGPTPPRRTIRNIRVISVGATPREGRAAARDADFVVLTRKYGGQTLHYAIDPSTLTRGLQGAKAGTPIGDVLGLQEVMRSPTVEVGRVPRALPHDTASQYLPLPRTRRTRVVLDRGTPVGVVEEVAPTIRGRRGTRSPKFESAAKPAEPAPRAPSRRSRSREVTVFVAADLPSDLVVDRTVSLSCRLSREELKAAATAASGAGGGKVDPTKELIVQVLPKQNVETVGDDRITTAVPAAGEVAEFLFDVRPTHGGDGEVWVVLRQGPAALVTLRLTATISGAATAAPAGRVSAEARVQTDATLVTGVDGVQWLRINERRNGEDTYYDYDVQSEELGILRQFTSPPLQNREAYVDGLYKKIEERWLSSKGDQQTFQRELRVFGGQLFDQLFPAELQDMLWENRNRLGHLMVMSQEPFIPWELVHLKERGKKLGAESLFLGQFGMVRWLWGTFPRPVRFRTRKGKVLSLCPAYANPDWVLTEVAQEEEFLKQHLGARAVRAEQGAVLDVIENGGFDLLHFAGHGTASNTAASDAKILLAGRAENGSYVEESLSASAVEQLADLADAKGNGPLVVLNACQAGRVARQLSSLGGFAEAFLGGGAGAFISSLWSVGDEPARTFVETLYTDLLGGATMAKAVVTAREKARADGDATWLAYVVYSHPGATLEHPDGS